MTNTCETADRSLLADDPAGQQCAGPDLCASGQRAPAQRLLEVLLVEDSPSDSDLTAEALQTARAGNRLHLVEDGVLALQFLRREPPYADAPRPDLILLDLNLPRKDGLEVLAEIKADPRLRSIPVVVLTTSQAPQDVRRVYELHGNCCISKPVDFRQFLDVVRAIKDFWLTLVKLPPRE